MTKEPGKDFDEFRERQKFNCWIQWQVVRRHSDYKYFCNNQSFDKTGRLVEDAVEGGKEIKKRFYLREIVDYRKELSEDECRFVCAERDVIPIWPHRDSFSTAELPGHGLFIYYGINVDPQVSWKDIAAKIKNHIRLCRATNKYWLEVIGREFSREEESKENREFGVEMMEKAESWGKDPKRIPNRKFLEEVFRIWDLHEEGKSRREIITMVWPEEFKRETSEADADREARYKKLSNEYEYRGIEDWDERAWTEVYVLDGIRPASGIGRLYVRVNDKLKRMKELFQDFLS
jgi:hypothetical protein